MTKSPSAPSAQLHAPSTAPATIPAPAKPLQNDPTPLHKPLLAPNVQTLDATKPALATIVTFDREKLFPSHIARAHGLNPSTMTLLEIPNGSSTLYNSLLQYSANYAVDIDAPLPEPTTPVTSSSSSSDTNNLIDKGINGVPIPRREGPGRLTSLWNCPDDRYDPFGYSDSDSDSDAESDSDSNSSGSDSESVDILAEEMEFVSLSALKTKSDPPVQCYQLGLGFAKVALGERAVYLHHWAYGLPVAENYSIQLYRSLILAGEDSHSLKELCAVALKWRSDREQANQRARPGRFTLFRFKTDGGGQGHWSNQGYKRSRPAKSIVLPEGQLESIVRDIKDFVAKDTKAWYESHGLPHRRSYLFHGPPGCGKTSTIRMIAGMFRLNACFLSLTASDFSNQVLQDALSNIPRRPLLVLEDVDVLFNEDRKSEVGTALTFSGMLNALDGLISVDGILCILTTNFIEKLDPALIRGGRVDRRFEFVHPHAKQIAMLFRTFYEDASQKLADRFADEILNRPEEESRSIATLQQHFIFTRKKSAEECVEMIPKFFEEFYPNGGKSRNHLYI